MPNLNLILKSQGGLGSEGLFTLLKPILILHGSTYGGRNFNMRGSLKGQGEAKGRGKSAKSEPVSQKSMRPRIQGLVHFAQASTHT